MITTQHRLPTLHLSITHPETRTPNRYHTNANDTSSWGPSRGNYSSPARYNGSRGQYQSTELQQ